MNLWILRPKYNDLWKPWYDKSFGFVVRASSPKKARKMVSKVCGDEGENAWLDPNNSSCKILESTGREGIIIEDYQSA